MPTEQPPKLTPELVSLVDEAIQHGLTSLIEQMRKHPLKLVEKTEPKMEFEGTTPGGRAFFFRDPEGRLTLKHADRLTDEDRAAIAGPSRPIKFTKPSMAAAPLLDPGPAVDLEEQEQKSQAYRKLSDLLVQAQADLATARETNASLHRRVQALEGPWEGRLYAAQNRTGWAEKEARRERVRADAATEVLRTLEVWAQKVIDQSQIRARGDLVHDIKRVGYGTDVLGKREAQTSLLDFAIKVRDYVRAALKHQRELP